MKENESLTLLVLRSRCLEAQVLTSLVRKHAETIVDVERTLTSNPRSCKRMERVGQDLQRSNWLHRSMIVFGVTLIATLGRPFGQRIRS
jgi:hypothetical protein